MASDIDINPTAGSASFDQIFTGFSSEAGGWTALLVYWGVRILAAVVILCIGWTLGRWADKRFEHAKPLDITLRNFLGNFFKYIIFTVTIITVIGLFGIPMASLLAVLGAAGLAIGLALQGTLSNIASGVMILVLRPFNVGDFIAFGSESGTVKTLGLFGTELATADNIYLYAPNSKVWGTEIKNYSRPGERRQDINIGISYSDDINNAIKVLENALNADSRILQTEDRKPEIIVDSLGDFTVNLIVRFWSKRSDMWALHGEMTKQLKERLEEAGISIPYPVRTVKLADDLSARH
jgi:small conductance mechanosensitive channel